MVMSRRSAPAEPRHTTTIGILTMLLSRKCDDTAMSNTTNLPARSSLTLNAPQNGEGNDHHKRDQRDANRQYAQTCTDHEMIDQVEDETEEQEPIDQQHSIGPPKRKCTVVRIGTIAGIRLVHAPKCPCFLNFYSRYCNVEVELIREQKLRFPYPSHMPSARVNCKRGS